MSILESANVVNVVFIILAALFAATASIFTGISAGSAGETLKGTRAMLISSATALALAVVIIVVSFFVNVRSAAITTAMFIAVIGLLIISISLNIAAMVNINKEITTTKTTDAFTTYRMSMYGLIAAIAGLLFIGVLPILTLSRGSECDIRPRRPVVKPTVNLKAPYTDISGARQQLRRMDRSL